MQIEFLGTGGAITIPRPTCNCRLCNEARAKGLPYTRTGPSLFVHGPDVLIDTPEEIKLQLNRSRVRHIAAALYSHWHPDHTLGSRVWEMNMDWRDWPPQNRLTEIFLPEQVAADFEHRLGLGDTFAYYESRGIVRLHRLTDGDAISLNDVQIHPIRLAEDYVYAFLFEGQDRRFLIAPDELYGWKPPAELRGLDMVVLPMGVLEFNPWNGTRRIPADHPVLTFEATFRQTLEMLDNLKPDRIIMTHIEEPDQLGYDDLCRLEHKLQAEGYPLEFAFDTLLIDV